MTAPNNCKQANVSFSGAGDNTVIAASTGNSLHVWSYDLLVAGATTLTFKDGASTTLAGFVIPAAAQYVKDQQTFPLFVTSPGNALIINLSGGVGVSGSIWYSLS